MGESFTNGDDNTKSSAPFKFSIPKTKPSGLATNSSSKGKRPRDEERKELITAVGENGLETLEINANSSLKIIPKQENSWRIKRQTKFLPPGEADPLSNPEERFEKETMEAGPEKNVQYGLRIMKRQNQDESNNQTNQASTIPGFDSEVQKLKDDLIDLPDESELEDYEAMPIEDFGAAMLRGMGWEKDKPIGRFGTGLVTPMEYVPRPDRLGLGATPKALETSKKILKPGETRESRTDLVVRSGPDGRVRHVKSLDEKLVKRMKEGVQVGKVMSIVYGRHKGLVGEVLFIEKMPPGSGHADKAILRLSINEETVSVRVKDLNEINVFNQSQSQSKTQKHEDEKSKSKPKSTEGSDKNRTEKEVKYGSNETVIKSSEVKQSTPVSHWLTPHIRVRIISKELQRGKFYLKKATVIDLISPSVCDLIMDDNREIIQGVDETFLETIVARKGGRVMVVCGKHRGKIGKVIDRHSETQSTVIQLTESFELITLSMDHVAEYEGEAEDFDS